MRTKEYTGIDLFRLAVAFFMVAIHTSPLADVSETGDFILTRVLARVGVPFFFMTSGFFLISRDVCHTKRLRDFEKKTAVIYGAAILLYLPVNVYQGYFQTEHFLPKLLKDLVFDGTLYHLWYLPATMLGALLAWGLMAKLGERRALAAASVLYLVGLFGDSYYGLTEQFSGVRCFYTQLFLVSDYTRNGIFFAPLFFLLGGILAQKERKKLSVCVAGFCVSFSLMLAEALLLRHFSLQRHDSMYLLLPFCMYFLFESLLHIRGRRLAFLRDVSLVIYLIHPLVIVMLRPAARLLGLWELLIENSVVHFLAVAALSAVFAVGGTALWRKYRSKRETCDRDRDRAYLEINVDNLAHNVRELRGLMQPGCELMAVVKAEAYGHGMYETAVHLNRLGVRAFAVATVDEGIRLRRCGILGEILVLGCTSPGRVRELVKYDLTQTVVDLGHALRLNAQRRTVKVHIKVDTGMHRLGFKADETEVLVKVCKLKYLKLCGIYTHLCVSDSLASEDAAYTRGQIDCFYQALDALKKRGDHDPCGSHPEQLRAAQLPGVKMRLCAGRHRFIRDLKSCRGTDDTNAGFKTGAFPKIQNHSAAPGEVWRKRGVWQSLCRGAGDAACRIAGRLCGWLSARTLVRERRRAHKRLLRACCGAGLHGPAYCGRHGYSECACRKRGAPDRCGRRREDFRASACRSLRDDHK